MTSLQVLQAITGVLTVFLGGTAAQLMMKWWTRKGENRKLHTASELDEATAFEKRTSAQNQFIDQLQEDGDTLRSQNAQMQAKVEQMEKRLVDAHQDFAERLEVSHAENARLRVRIAQLDTDLDIVTRQRDDYRRRGMGDRPGHSRED